MYGHDEFGARSKDTVQCFVLTVTDLESLRDSGSYTAKSRQLTELGSSHCAGSSIWLLFQHVLLVSLSRFGAVVQAVKEHVKVSFFPSGRG